MENIKTETEILTVKQLEHFIWQLEMAYAELKTFESSNYSVSEIDRVDECNGMLMDALYENCKDSEMTFPEKLKELFKHLAHIQQTK
jgi:hypothetical protein